jgi:hypothetical protein
MVRERCCFPANGFVRFSDRVHPELNAADLQATGTFGDIGSDGFGTRGQWAEAVRSTLWRTGGANRFDRLAVCSRPWMPGPVLRTAR